MGLRCRIIDPFKAAASGLCLRHCQQGEIILTLLFRLLQRIPAVGRLQNERDELLAEQNSARLKLRAASAEMGVLEEQCRVLKRERDQVTETMARQTADQASQIKAMLAEHAILAKQCDDSAVERRVLITQRDAIEIERDQIARDLDGLRSKVGAAEVAR